MSNKKADLLPPIHPGEILREEYLQPLGLSINRLARDLHVPPGRVSEIVNKRRGITADTAIRLGVYFSTSPDFWINLQKRYELETASRGQGKEIAKEVHPRASAASA